ncbi:MAG: class I SAM-dependent methyltransferase [Candidatus Bathyarchaeota archaeon]|nr:class I SAM-dependent methyltransferase [Candidatus Bathyarchaeota archaeon]
MSEPAPVFYKVLEQCREVFKETVFDFKHKGADFDSMVYAEGVRSHIDTVKQYMGKTSGLMADLGCGKGHISVLLKDAGYEMIGLDIPEPTGEFSHLSLRLWQKKSWKALGRRFGTSYGLSDIKTLPIKDGVLDGVMMYAVIEHISTEQSEVKKNIDEVKRVLKPGGYLFIFRCPRKGSYAEKLASILGLPKHDKLYGDSELKEMLASNFTVLEFARTDMILAFMRCQPLWNKLSPLLLALDSILLKTPVSVLSHHLMVVCQKR